jgi:hypothetical protein
MWGSWIRARGGARPTGLGWLSSSRRCLGSGSYLMRWRLLRRPRWLGSLSVWAWIPGALRGYGKRAQTRSDHLAKVARYLGWKTAADGSREMKELEQFLLDRAMEHDSPTLLFNLAREYLMSAKVIRPGAVTLAKMVGKARAGAGELTSQKVEHHVASRQIPGHEVGGACPGGNRDRVRSRRQVTVPRRLRTRSSRAVPASEN